MLDLIIVLVLVSFSFLFSIMSKRSKNKHSDIRSIVEKLEELKQKGYKNHRGICSYMMDEYAFYDHREMWTEHKMKFFNSWKHFSGYDSYPVPSTNHGFSPHDQFFQFERWEGKQLELRLDLIDHLIKCFNKL